MYIKIQVSIYKVSSKLEIKLGISKAHKSKITFLSDIKNIKCSYKRNKFMRVVQVRITLSLSLKHERHHAGHKYGIQGFSLLSIKPRVEICRETSIDFLRFPKCELKIAIS